MPQCWAYWEYNQTLKLSLFYLFFFLLFYIFICFLWHKHLLNISFLYYFMELELCKILIIGLLTASNVHVLKGY